MNTHIIILAAGQGTRMKSNLAKVLHLLAGKPLIHHVIDKALLLNPSKITVVVGHQGEAVRSSIESRYGQTSKKSAPVCFNFVEQNTQMGTAHAVLQAAPLIAADEKLLILYGDVPLYVVDEITPLMQAIEEEQTVAHTLHLLSARLDNPFGYGRIVRHEDGINVTHIIEQKDLKPHQHAIQEVNTGIMAGPAHLFLRLLPIIEQSPVGEYYLTDMVKLCVAESIPVNATLVREAEFFFGINDPLQLAQSERLLQKSLTAALMLRGTRFADPARVDIRGELKTGMDVDIDINTIFKGTVSLGDRVKIGAHCYLDNVSIAEDTVIEPFSHLVNCTIGAHAKIGPYARLRPDTVLANNTHIGNFVEVKKSTVGEGSKINHLSYIGDAQIGKAVNVGAGTITCNYDGVNKHKTIIEDGAFIGSDTQLVAPVTVGAGATLGAGTTLTKNAPADALTISRTPQLIIKNWEKPQKA